MGLSTWILIKKESLKRLLKDEHCLKDMTFLEKRGMEMWDDFSDSFKSDVNNQKYTSLELLNKLYLGRLDDMEYKNKWIDILTKYDLLFICGNSEGIDEMEDLKKEDYIWIIDIFDKVFWFASDRLDEFIKIDLEAMGNPQPKLFI